MKRVREWWRRLMWLTEQTELTDPRRELRSGWDKKKLRERLAALAADDPLWGQMQEMFDAYLLAEVEAGAKAGLEDGEAHRCRGRFGMLLDLRADWDQVWREAHSPKAEG